MPNGREMLVAGNWKMFTDLAAAVRLASEVVRKSAEAKAGVHVALCPPFVSLEAVAEIVRGSGVRLGAQNMHDQEEGAFTGEVSAPMLTSVGCDMVIVGHSERRSYFAESDEMVGRKVRAAVAHRLVPIVCVGETLEERDQGEERSVVERQLRAALSDVELTESDQIVVAYEPVWAIGTGRTASPEQAQEMHAHIRSLLAALEGDRGLGVAILYGGSVKPDNASDMFAQPDIDGGLIGGASLDPVAFGEIIAAAG